MPRAFLATLLVVAATACAAPPRADVLARIEGISPIDMQARVESITAHGPRSTMDADNVRATVEHIRAVMQRYGYAVSTEPFSIQTRGPVTREQQDGSLIVTYGFMDEPSEHVNVVAEKRGTTWPDQVIEIGAHYDSVMGTVGADDNASGVAALLEMARLLAEVPVQRTVRFLFFAMEEEGLHGSRAHVAELVRRGEAESLDAVAVLDCVAYTDHTEGSQTSPIRIPFLFWPPRTGDFLAVIGNWSSGSLADDYADAADRYAPELPRYGIHRLAGLTKHSRRSDHAPYWDAGIAAIAISDAMPMRSATYHQPSDTPETLDYPFLAQVTRATAAWLIERAGLPEPDAP